MDFYIIVGLIIFGLLFYIWFNNKRQKQIRDKEIRNSHYDYIMQRIEKIRLGTAEFSRYLENESGYFNNYRLVSWSDNYSDLVDGLKSRPFEFIRLDANDVEIIKKFVTTQVLSQIS